MVTEKDSVYFAYENKPTQKFPVKNINDPAAFNISLHVPVKSKYRTLKEVIVYSKSYQQDSMENRDAYKDIFNYHKPGINSSITPDGTVGMDVNELINMFRFKRNKRLRAFQLRLEEQEQERYVNYRFNRTLVHRITQLEGAQLDSFMIRYRPPYEFLLNADEISFNQYVLDASYEFKADLLKPKEAVSH